MGGEERLSIRANCGDGAPLESGLPVQFWLPEEELHPAGPAGRRSSRDPWKADESGSPDLFRMGTSGTWTPVKLRWKHDLVQPGAVEPTAVVNEEYLLMRCQSQGRVRAGGPGPWSGQQVQDRDLIRTLGEWR